MWNEGRVEGAMMSLDGTSERIYAYCILYMFILGAHVYVNVYGSSMCMYDIYIYICICIMHVYIVYVYVCIYVYMGVCKACTHILYI